jgi:hypothetical protein
MATAISPTMEWNQGELESGLAARSGFGGGWSFAYRWRWRELGMRSPSLLFVWRKKRGGVEGGRVQKTFWSKQPAPARWHVDANTMKIRGMAIYRFGTIREAG